MPQQKTHITVLQSVVIKMEMLITIILTHKKVQLDNLELKHVQINKIASRHY
jgi:hypothetical protein